MKQNNHDIRIILSFLGLVVLVAAVSATQFTISNIRVDAVGGTATGELRMDRAPPAGFSGYIINLTVANPSVAEISAVTYNPDLGGLRETTPRPFTGGHIGWADTDEVLQAQGSETNVLLATITMKGRSPGSTTLNAVMTMVSDDKGGNMIPSSTISSPAVTVGGQPVSTVTPIPLPDSTVRPSDRDGDGLCEDLNGDGTVNYSDVSLYFNNWHWIENNEPVALFDYDHNGAIDFGDIIALNQMRG